MVAPILNTSETPTQCPGNKREDNIWKRVEGIEEVQVVVVRVQVIAKKVFEWNVEGRGQVKCKVVL